MKAKKLVLFLVMSIAAIMFIGCGKKEAKEEKEKEEVQEEIEVEEPQGPVHIRFDAYRYVFGTIVYGENGDESKELETDFIEFEAMPGEMMSEVWENNGYMFQRIYADGEYFEGWMEYKTNKTIDGNGNDTFDYERVSGDKLYTTEEIMAMQVPEYDVAYVAKWKTILADDYDDEFEMMYAEEEVNEEDMGDETLSDIAYLILDANGGQMTYGTDDVYKTEYYTYILEDGKTLKKIMKSEMEDQLRSIEKSGKKFAGWKVYEGAYKDMPEKKSTDLKKGDECFEIADYVYLELGKCKVYGESVSTEELGKINSKGKTYYAVAVWK